MADLTPGRPLIPPAQVAALIPAATSSRLYTQMNVQAGDTLTATTTAEQTYASQAVIPANSLIVGQTVRITGAGVYTTAAVLPPTQRARLRLGGALLVDSGAQSVLVSLTAARYMFDLQFIVRSLGVTGSVEAFGLLHFATSLATTVPVLGGPSGTFGDAGNPVTVNTTIDQPLALSVQFSAVQTGNSNSMRQISVTPCAPSPDANPRQHHRPRLRHHTPTRTTHRTTPPPRRRPMHPMRTTHVPHTTPRPRPHRPARRLPRTRPPPLQPTRRRHQRQPQPSPTTTTSRRTARQPHMQHLRLYVPASSPETADMQPNLLGQPETLLHRPHSANPNLH